MYNLKKNKGFTLVELIVVIVILGILAVIAAPKLMSMKVEAKNAVLQGLAASLKSAADEFHAKAVLAGVDLEHNNGGVIIGDATRLFDYKTGFSFDKIKDPAGAAAAEATCFASPTCTGIQFGYPAGYRNVSDYNNTLINNSSYVQGEGTAHLSIAKLLNADSKFSSIITASVGFSIFYFTEDQPIIDRTNFVNTSWGYPTAIPCTITYIQALKGNHNSINDASYDQTTNQFSVNGSIYIPGDRKPHIFVQPCIK